ncbi:MAG: Maf family protein [Panacagrimonas sp.]
MMPPLVLASTSHYRADLLSRLRLPFEALAPDIDETPQPRETAQKVAPRLSLAKAQAVASQRPGHWVLGSDQAASCDGRLLGKPGTRTAACEQLSWMAGRYAAFVTGLALINTNTAKILRGMDVTVVRLRRLSTTEIERYVDLEPALDCAGSFKMEGLGISLFDEIQSRDPTGLIGLPLIETAKLLRKAGYDLP